MKPKFGTPLNEDGTAPCRFAVIGMGKLGGFELNFSSDIDLIFVYSDEGKTDEGIDNSEYYTRLCEFIIKAMSEVTVEGYVFRVDIRLRPESSAGVIIRSMESYESYYEGWGDLWERQALIKARSVAGDMAFGDEFIRMIRPFVYQRYLDGVTLNEIKVDIRNTKARIEERLVSERADLEKHVKLGPGAIRDIEFTVQCLQMIHGGKRKSLCSQNTLETIAALKANELLQSAGRRRPIRSLSVFYGELKTPYKLRRTNNVTLYQLKKMRRYNLLEGWVTVMMHLKRFVKITVPIRCMSVKFLRK